MTEAATDSSGMAVPTFTIIADGNPLAAELEVSSVEVAANSGDLQRATIMILGGWSDIIVMPIGAEIEISASMTGVAQPIFSGIVQQRGATCLICAGPTVTIVSAGTLAPGIPVALAYGESIIDFIGTVTSDAGVDRCSGTVRSNGVYAAIGGTVTLAGIGVPFDGAKTINRVRHDIRNGNWTTEIGFDDAAPPAG